MPRHLRSRPLVSDDRRVGFADQRLEAINNLHSLPCRHRLRHRAVGVTGSAHAEGVGPFGKLEGEAAVGRRLTEQLLALEQSSAWNRAARSLPTDFAGKRSCSNRWRCDEFVLVT